MNQLAVTQQVTKVELDANAALKEAWRLYRRLFLRSVGMAAAIFGALDLLRASVRSGHGGLAVALAAVVLSFAGVALLQGGLVEVVRGLHDDGDADSSVGAAFQRSSTRLLTLLAVALLTGLGVGLGFLLLIVPGFVLMTRWSVAVPVAMFEPVSASTALRRSREIVRGNEWAVFKVIFGVWALTVLVAIPFALAAANMGTLGWWVATSLASALTAPYSAHALTVVYYGLVDPQRPVVLEPGQRWQSVWDVQAAEASAPAPSIWDEYERRWGD